MNILIWIWHTGKPLKDLVDPHKALERHIKKPVVRNKFDQTVLITSIFWNELRTDTLLKNYFLSIRLTISLGDNLGIDLQKQLTLHASGALSSVTTLSFFQCTFYLLPLTKIHLLYDHLFLLFLLYLRLWNFDFLPVLFNKILRFFKSWWASFLH